MANFVIFLIVLTFSICLSNSFKLPGPTENLFRFNNIQSIGNFTEIQNKWSLKAIPPSYIQNLLELYNRRKSFQSASPSAKQDFVKRILDGVTSDGCKVHVTEWFTRISLENLEGLLGKKDAWVLQMIDSWGKLPEGILSGHVNSYGDFDECVGVKVTDLEILNTVYPDLNENVVTNFAGRYCTSYILDYTTAMSLTQKPVDNNNAVMKTKFEIQQETVSLLELLQTILLQKPSALMIIPSMGVCMPSSCSVTDVQQILVNGLNLMYENNVSPLNKTTLPWPVTINCAIKEKPSLDAAAISVLVLLGTLITLALIAGVFDYWDNNVRKIKEKGIVYNYLMAFSMYTNMKKLLSTRKSSDDLGCIHGIRFLSTAWVVLAHTYGISTLGPQWNTFDFRNIYKNWTNLAVINGTFSVDTFFLMSGLLATYNILKMLDKSKGKFNVAMFYVHRYIRLTPTYAILVGVGATLVNYAGNGPSWFVIEAEVENCRKNWWTNLLYINNLYKTDEMCNRTSWYLANDMQFYILSPLIVYPIWRWKKVGLSLLAGYTILGAIAQVLVVIFSEQQPAMVITNLIESMKGTTEIYNRPWSRIGVFLIGVWLGWLLHKTRDQRLNLHRLVVVVLWICSTVISFAVIFGIHSWFGASKEIPEVGGYFYAGLSRMSWGISVSWIIFACIKGYGGPVNRFLSWSVFMPLGRLCFCVYLTSVHLQYIFNAGLTVPIRYRTYTNVNIYFAHMVMSYMVGFLCTLFFESPFIMLQKLIFEGGAKRQDKQGSMSKLSEETLSGNSGESGFKDKVINKVIP